MTTYCYSIIFVHGLGSNPDTTWQAKRSGQEPGDPTSRCSDGTQFVNWVKDFLPSDLSEDKYEDTRIYFYNYESYWKRDAVNTRLATLGNELLHSIRGIRRSGAVCNPSAIIRRLLLTVFLPY